MLKSKKLYILAFGVTIAVVQVLGVPGSWKSTVAVVLGIAVAVLAFLIKQEEIRRETPRARSGDAYAEDLPAQAGPSAHATGGEHA